MTDEQKAGYAKILAKIMEAELTAKEIQEDLRRWNNSIKMKKSRAKWEN